jgi:hypothetical protein
LWLRGCDEFESLEATRVIRPEMWGLLIVDIQPTVGTYSNIEAVVRQALKEAYADLAVPVRSVTATLCLATGNRLPIKV